MTGISFLFLMQKADIILNIQEIILFYICSSKHVISEIKKIRKLIILGQLHLCIYSSQTSMTRISNSFYSIVKFKLNNNSN
jgi:hypothetical protein